MGRPRKIKAEHIGANLTETVQNSGAAKSSVSEHLNKISRRRTQIDTEGIKRHLGALEQAQLRKEEALANLREYESREKAGELVELAPMLRLWSSMGQMLKDQLLGMPDRICGELAALTDPRMVRDALVKELRAVLQNIPENLNGFRHSSEAESAN